MPEDFPLSPKNHVMKVNIAGQVIDLNLRFMSRSLYNFLSYSIEKKDYREAFLCMIYGVYKEREENKEDMLSIEEFSSISDEELSRVFQLYLRSDKKIYEKYEEILCDNPYERYYIAANEVFLQISEEAKGRIEPVIKSVADSIKTISSGIFMPEIYKDAEVAINTVTAMAKEMGEYMSQHLRKVSELLPRADEFFGNLDKQNRVYHETMKSFQWWCMTDIPISALDYIHANRDSLTKDEVDRYLCEFYRENEFERLDSMMGSWQTLDSFKKCKVTIEEVKEIHKRGYYHSSVTVLTILMEGVIRRYVESMTGEKKYRFGEVGKLLREQLNLQLEDDHFLLDSLLTESVKVWIDEIFGKSFSPEFSEQVPEFNRHKRTHGYAFEEQAEVDSLKLILKINELFYLFQSKTFLRNN